MSVAAVLIVVAVGVLVVGAAAGIPLFFALRSRKANRVDPQQFQHEIQRLGWTFSSRDDSPVELFNRQFAKQGWGAPLAGPPTASAARDVVSGVHRGRRFIAAVFDVSYNGGRGRDRAIWVAAPARHPRMDLKRVPRLQNTVNRPIGRAGMAIGHAEFDARFELWSEDPGFARAVLLPGLADFLLADPRTPRMVFFRGEFLDALDPVGDHRDPRQLLPALDYRCDVLDRIPNWR